MIAVRVGGAGAVVAGAVVVALRHEISICFIYEDAKRNFKTCKSSMDDYSIYLEGGGEVGALAVLDILGC